LRDDDNFFLSARISFWIFKKSIFCFFWRSLFFLTAPLVWVKPLLSWLKLNQTWFFTTLP
jgi:hypothetical protein